MYLFSSGGGFDRGSKKRSRGTTPHSHCSPVCPLNDKTTISQTLNSSTRVINTFVARINRYCSVRRGERKKKKERKSRLLPPRFHISGITVRNISLQFERATYPAIIRAIRTYVAPSFREEKKNRKRERLERR